jgi:hypothetical protein
VLRWGLDCWQNRFASRAFFLLAQRAAIWVSDLFQTHNIALTRSVAQFTVSLGLEGRVISQGSIQEALDKDVKLSIEASDDQARLEAADEKTDASSTAPEKPAASGKLIVEEELVEGGVGWSAGQCVLLNFPGLLYPYSSSTTISPWPGWSSPHPVFPGVTSFPNFAQLCAKPTNMVPGSLVLSIRYHACI